MLGDLIELIARLWQADSSLGESEMDRRSRRFLGWIVAAIIALLVLAVIALLWETRDI